MGHDEQTVRRVLDAALGEGRSALTAPEGRALCGAYGIPTAAEAVADSAEEAVALAAELGGPVALKIVSPDILPKTDAGCVLTGVRGAAQVREG